ncbi:hypothetical protein [Maritimibacter sp. DP1N21-5]|uniref:hypothetical protein n=1 Tax=Maritimibacter sp. DP1N21-5 TaxID=2836867 RepID=UPI001C47F5BE|nr:hypothetical protein [Maritimibacter sp. DP1N21-5]MBV7408208.1 hypothetical protein [Maritimibacter sp. DP1N21-5]
MYVGKPIALSLVSVSEAEDDAPLFNPATTYALGDFVIDAGVVYVSSIDGNLGFQPSEEVQELEGARWITVGATNIRRFLDGIRSSRTTGDTPLVLEVEAVDGFNSIGLLGLEATRTTVEVISGSTVLETREVLAGPVPVDNYWDLRNTVFNPILRRKVLQGMAGFAGARIRVTLEGPAPALGLLLACRAVKFGDTLFAPTTRIRRKTFATYSTSFGITKATRRPTAHDTTYTVRCAQAGFHGIDLIMDEIDGLEVLTWATENRPELINYGYLSLDEMPVEIPKDYVFQAVNAGVI